MLAPDGRLVHEWSDGVPDEEWVQIRERMRGMFEDAGVANPFHPGVRTEEEVEAFLIEEGMARTRGPSFLARGIR